MVFWLFEEARGRIAQRGNSSRRTVKDLLLLKGLDDVYMSIRGQSACTLFRNHKTLDKDTRCFVWFKEVAGGKVSRSLELDAVVHPALFENVAESLANGDVGFALGAVDEFRQGAAARSAFETLSGGHHWRRVERRSNGGGWRGRRGVSRGSGGSGGRSSGGSGSLVRSPGCESVADNVTYR